MSNPFLTQSLNNQNINVTSSSLVSIKMEQIKDVSVTNLEAGQVLIYNGDIWQNIIPQSVVNDTLGSLLDVKVSNLQNQQFLSYNSTSKMWNNLNISESNVTNLVSDLLSCEKSINKNVAKGYCPLDSNSLIPVNKTPSDLISRFFKII